MSLTEMPGAGKSLFDTIQELQLEVQKSSQVTIRVVKQVIDCVSETTADDILCKTVVTWSVSGDNTLLNEAQFWAVVHATIRELTRGDYVKTIPVPGSTSSVQILWPVLQGLHLARRCSILLEKWYPTFAVGPSQLCWEMANMHQRHAANMQRLSTLDVRANDRLLLELLLGIRHSQPMIHQGYAEAAHAMEVDMSNQHGPTGLPYLYDLQLCTQDQQSSAISHVLATLANRTGIFMSVVIRNLGMFKVSKSAVSTQRSASKRGFKKKQFIQLALKKAASFARTAPGAVYVIAAVYASTVEGLEVVTTRPDGKKYEMALARQLIGPGFIPPGKYTTLSDEEWLSVLPPQHRLTGKGAYRRHGRRGRFRSGAGRRLWDELPPAMGTALGVCAAVAVVACIGYMVYQRRSYSWW